MNYFLIIYIIITGQLGFWIGYFVAKEKFRHPREAGSVSKNEHSGNLCAHDLKKSVIMKGYNYCNKCSIYTPIEHE